MSDDLVDWRSTARDQLDAEFMLDAELADLSSVEHGARLDFRTSELRLIQLALSELRGREDLLTNPLVRGVPLLLERLQSEIAQREAMDAAKEMV